MTTQSLANECSTNVCWIKTVTLVREDNLEDEGEKEMTCWAGSPFRMTDYSEFIQELYR